MFYDITTTLKSALLEDDFVNVVSEGNIDDVDLQKKTVFPLSHIMITNILHEDALLRFSVELLLLDIVDISKSQTKDVFRGNNNEHDVLNTQLNVGLRLMERFRRGDLFTDDYQLDGEPNFSKIVEGYENGLAGWSLTFDILYQHEMTVCPLVTVPPETCAAASYTVEYADGTLIESGTIASGSSKTITVPNCPVAEDATWTLTDTNGNTLDTGIIPSGGSATIVAPDATININGSLWDTVESGGTENIIVRQSTGSTQVGSKQGQYYRISDSNIQNSDGSYDLDVKAENSLVLPDSQINVNSVNEGSVVSVKTIDVNLSDSSGTVTPDAIVLTGNSLDITLPDAAGGSPSAGATLLKTGQTTSYQSGDDGDIQAGRLTDWYTLPFVPVNLDGSPTANTTNARFTDELGGTAYANNIVIDWSTFDNNTSTVLGVYRNFGSTVTWSNAITNAAALSVGTFTTGWRNANIRELNNFSLRLSALSFYYAPIGSPNNHWSSTSYFSSSLAWYMSAVGVVNATAKTSSHRYFPVRTFTVTGTTLT